MPEELFVWFGWHDGGETPASWWSLPGFIPTTAGRSLLQRTGIDQLDEDSSWGVDRGWIPLEDGNRGCAIELIGPASSPPRLRMALPDFGSTAVEDRLRAVSLCTVVTWWLVGMRTGGYRWDAEDGRWVTEPLLLDESQRWARFF